MQPSSLHFGRAHSGDAKSFEIALVRVQCLYFARVLMNRRRQLHLGRDSPRQNRFRVKQSLDVHAYRNQRLDEWLARLREDYRSGLSFSEARQVLLSFVLHVLLELRREQGSGQRHFARRFLRGRDSMRVHSQHQSRDQRQGMLQVPLLV